MAMATNKLTTPRLVDELQKKHVIYVAAELFSTNLSMSSSLDSLRESLKAEMIKNPACVVCNGKPCEPSSHLFQPQEYQELELLEASGYTQANLGNLLLGDTSSDRVVSQNENDFVSGANSNNPNTLHSNVNLGDIVNNARNAVASGAS